MGGPVAVSQEARLRSSRGMPEAFHVERRRLRRLSPDTPMGSRSPLAWLAALLLMPLLLVCRCACQTGGGGGRAAVSLARFERRAFVFTVPEDSAPGSTVGTVSAASPEPGLLADFSLADDDDAGGSTFLVDRRSGAIRLLRSLDREARPFYALTLSVTAVPAGNSGNAGDSRNPRSGGGGGGVESGVTSEGSAPLGNPPDASAGDGDTPRVAGSAGNSDGSGTLARVYVSVLDVNDNAPAFASSRLEVEVCEDAALGAAVVSLNASDPDEGENAALDFEITSGDPERRFSVDARGVLRVARPLDRESRPSYNLLVTTADRAAPPAPRFTASATVLVRVLDANDNGPAIVALRVSGRGLVPREEPEEGGARPAFTLTVPEDVAPGSTVATVVALDPDEGENAEVEFSLSWSQPEGSRPPPPFTIGARDGVIRTSADLDRESNLTSAASSGRYELMVLASDRAGVRATATPQPPPIGAATVLVIAEDVNDNRPRFAAPAYRVRVPEDARVGAIVARLLAADADAGLNGRVRYRIVPRRQRHELCATDDCAGTGVEGSRRGDTEENNADEEEERYDDDDDDTAFRIDPVTGELRVARGLDRERRDAYRLLVEARDGGSPAPLASAVAVAVSVTDVNDHVPSFGSDGGRGVVAGVPEGLGGPGGRPLQIAQLSAHDDDLGPAGVVSYAVVGGDYERDAFSLSASGRLDLLRPLDREARPRHLLLVTATDAGSPPLTGTATLTVLVGDANDNAPRFPGRDVRLQVEEGGAAGTVLWTARAEDPDEGPNGTVTYRLEGGEGALEIDATTGELRTLVPLDRELRDGYPLLVWATDGGARTGGALSTSVSVLVTVTDVNDNGPAFLNAPYVASVPTPTPSGALIFVPTAVDADYGANASLRFSLSGDDAHLLALDPSLGSLSAAAPLRGPADFTVHLTATELAPPHRSAATTVTVRFRNAASFPRPRVHLRSPPPIVLPEDAPAGTTVARVEAETSRPGAAPVWFYAAGGGDGPFDVERASGAVSLARPLDFEERASVAVFVECRDAGFPPFSSYVRVDVAITDVNDNAPRFERDPVVCQVLENTPAGPIPGCVLRASDADAGPSGAMRYSLAPTLIGLPAFAVDPASGQLGTLRPLDRETGATHELLALADDGDGRTATAVVAVTVLDVDDNPPRFPRIFAGAVPEDAAPGTAVLRAWAEDEDEGDNAAVSYSLVPTAMPAPFSVEPETGVVRVAAPLDREAAGGGRHALRLLARGAAFAVNTDVVVVVTDVNDNAPAFIGAPPSPLVVPECLLEGGCPVVRMAAADPDDGENGEVFYSLGGGDDDILEEFRVHASTGEISTRGRFLLPRPPTQSSALLGRRVLLTLVASDCGRPEPLTSETMLAVDLVYANEHPPVFSAPLYVTTVVTSAPVGSRVLRVSASDDRDLGPAAEVVFSVVDGNGNGSAGPGLFTVDPASGWLTLRSALRGRAGTTLSLAVRAQDRGLPRPLSAEAAVLVRVIEDGWAARVPAFSRAEFVATVPECAPLGSTVLLAVAEAAEDAAGPPLVYSLSGAGAAPFSVDAGVVHLATPLDFETTRSYRYIVSARDGWGGAAATAVVTVTVADCNDNAPAFERAEYRTELSEAAPLGTFVVVVRARDADGDGDGAPRYLLADPALPFAIDTDTGVVVTAGRLDYEARPRYRFVVIAMDGPPGAAARLSGTALVRVELLDENEFPPRFSAAGFVHRISESAAPGTHVGTISATDQDAGRAGRVEFHLVGAESAARRHGLRLDLLSGEVVVVGKLASSSSSSPAVPDSPPDAVARVTLTVVAKNPGAVTSAERLDEAAVTVIVTDANEAPRFLRDVYRARVREDAPSGTPVISVMAHDPDRIPQFARFSFRLGDDPAAAAAAPASRPAFAIDAASGLVTSASPLDRETCDAYALLVLAVDEGSPAATGTAILRVDVDDANDNAPVLTSVRWRVDEGLPPGTPVARLSSRDADAEENGPPFSYRLAQPSRFFALSDDGVLRTTAELDREETGEVALAVVVSDSGTPQLTSVVEVTVEVGDVNDNAPSPRPLDILVSFFGTTFPGGFLGDVRPLDLDSDDEFTCRIVGNAEGADPSSAPPQSQSPSHLSPSSSGAFSITPGTCNLLSEPRDCHGTPATVVLWVEASDGLHTPVLSAARLRFIPYDGASLAGAALLSLGCTELGRFLDAGLAPLLASASALLSSVGADLRVLHAFRHGNASYAWAALARTDSGGDGRGFCARDARRFLRALSARDPNPDPNARLGGLFEVVADTCRLSDCVAPARCMSRGPAVGPGLLAVTESETFVLVSHGAAGPLWTCECPPGAAAAPECDGEMRGAGAGVAALTTGVPVENGAAAGGAAIGEAAVEEEGSGAPCEERGFGFQGSSFMEFPARILDLERNEIRLEVATTRTSAQLLLLARDDGGRWCLSVWLMGGRASVSLDLGGEVTTVEAGQGLSDGNYHTIAALRRGKTLSVHVDDCEHSGEVQNLDHCQATGTIAGNSSIIWPLSNGSVSVGGADSTATLPGVLGKREGRPRGLDGCLRGVSVDALPLAPWGARRTMAVADTCPLAGRELLPAEGGPGDGGPAPWLLATITAVPLLSALLAAAAVGAALALLARRRRRRRSKARGSAAVASAAGPVGLAAERLACEKPAPKGGSVNEAFVHDGGTVCLSRPDIIVEQTESRPYAIVDERALRPAAPRQRQHGRMFAMGRQLDEGDEEEEEDGTMRRGSHHGRPEHYDLENASSIAASDADVEMHYRTLRARGADTTMGHRPQHRHPPLHHHHQQQQLDKEELHHKHHQCLYCSQDCLSQKPDTCHSICQCHHHPLHPHLEKQCTDDSLHRRRTNHNLVGQEPSLAKRPGATSSQSHAGDTSSSSSLCRCNRGSWPRSPVNRTSLLSDRLDVLASLASAGDLSRHRAAGRQLATPCGGVAGARRSEEFPLRATATTTFGLRRPSPDTVASFAPPSRLSREEVARLGVRPPPPPSPPGEGGDGEGGESPVCAGERRRVEAEESGSEARTDSPSPDGSFTGSEMEFEFRHRPSES
ncbi:protocadherin Fat 4-like [Petromyzon marinus]|uniref:protocadherin Fat 4-like n=1 Tax=Petromyzon marinus TaxID=7757 RepID=UPI003F6FD04C